MAKNKDKKEISAEDIAKKVMSNDDKETEEKPDIDPSDGEPVEAKQEEDKPKIINVNDVRGNRQHPGTGQHKYSRGFGYNPE